MTNTVLTAVFIVVTVLNLIAFARHWMMMRALQVCLDGLIESQRLFTELEKTRHLPEDEAKAAFEKTLQGLRQ